MVLVADRLDTDERRGRLIYVATRGSRRSWRPRPSLRERHCDHCLRAEQEYRLHAGSPIKSESPWPSMDDSAARFEAERESFGEAPPTAGNAMRPVPPHGERKKGKR